MYVHTYEGLANKEITLKFVFLLHSLLHIYYNMELAYIKKIIFLIHDYIHFSLVLIENLCPIQLSS